MYKNDREYSFKISYEEDGHTKTILCNLIMAYVSFLLEMKEATKVVTNHLY